MVVQVNPITQSLPATTAIQDPAVRQFANAVADALRAINSPEGSVKALVEALEAVGTGSQVSPVSGPNGTPHWVSEIYKSRLYAALKLPVAQIVRREGLGSDDALEVIEDNNTVIVSALNAMWATIGASGVFTEDGKNIVANWTTAQAEKWSQIEAEVLSAGGQTIRAALAEESDARATLEGQVSSSWMVKAEVDVGTGKPYVAGIALGAEGQGGSATSEFLVRADRFAVVMPGYGEHIPFAIGAGNVSFNGLTNWSNVQGKTGFASISQITPDNVSTYIAQAALGNAQIGGNIWSSNWSGWGGAGWLLDRNGNFYGNNIYARGDIQASSLKAGVAMVDALNIKGSAMIVPIFISHGAGTWNMPYSQGVWQHQEAWKYTFTTGTIGTFRFSFGGLWTITHWTGHANWPVGTVHKMIRILIDGNPVETIAQLSTYGGVLENIAIGDRFYTIGAGTHTVSVYLSALMADGGATFSRSAGSTVLQSHSQGASSI